MLNQAPVNSIVLLLHSIDMMSTPRAGDLCCHVLTYMADIMTGWRVNNEGFFKKNCHEV